MDWEKIKLGGWSALGGAAVLAVVGFNYGGWVTGGTAAAMAKEIAVDAVADRLGKICAAQFNRDSEKNAKLKEMKEKDLVKDTKEKERKEIIKEGKEFKEKDFKDVQEKTREVIGGGIFHTSTEGGDVESRLRNLENMIQQLSHFISGESRPDLYGALYNQAGYGQEDDLEKNSNDAKQSKDSKDMESL